MSAKRWLSWMGIVAATVMAAGCAEEREPDGSLDGQIGGIQGEDNECVVVTTTVLGVDDASPLGVSASQLLASIGGQRQAPLTWKNGQTTTLTLEPGAPQAVRFLELEPDDSGMDIAPLINSCKNRLEIDTTLAFATADGKFAESFNVTLRAEEPDSASFAQKLNLSSLHGSYTLTELDASQFEAVNLFADGKLSTTSIEGAIFAIAESRSSSSDPDSAVAATDVKIASY